MIDGSELSKTSDDVAAKPPELPSSTRGRTQTRTSTAVEKRKRDRATDRAVKFKEREVPANEFLRRQRVTPKTQDTYQAIVDRFYNEEKLKRTDDVALIDRALNRRILKMYLTGEHIGTARYLLHALKWDKGVKAKLFPKALSAIAGFKSVSHETMKDPNSWEAVLLAAEAGCRANTKHSVTAAAASLVQFDTLARPSEVLLMDGDWVFKTKSSEGNPVAALTFFPSSQSSGDKNKQQDDTIVIGEVTHVPWLTQLMLGLKAKCGEQKFFGITLAQYESEFTKNAAAAGLARLKMTPHGNRHGGASRMSLEGLDSVKIQTRGRWSSNKSVMRYKKHGRYLRVQAALTDDERARARHALLFIKSALATHFKLALTGAAPSRREPVPARAGHEKKECKLLDKGDSVRGKKGHTKAMRHPALKEPVKAPPLPLAMKRKRTMKPISSSSETTKRHRTRAEAAKFDPVALEREVNKLAAGWSKSLTSAKRRRS